MGTNPDEKGSTGREPHIHSSFPVWRKRAWQGNCSITGWRKIHVEMIRWLVVVAGRWRGSREEGALDVCRRIPQGPW